MGTRATIVAFVIVISLATHAIPETLNLESPIAFVARTLEYYGDLETARIVRNLPTPPSNKLIWVNIPTFSLVYFSPSGNYSHHRIITGSAAGKNRTPLMTSFVTAIQVNPWWYPTPRIAKESPKYRKPIPPGPSNPLGTVKLVIDSPFTVFLHDTPHQHLFDREFRAYSHGCIRTEDAEILAGLILEDDNQNINIDELIESGKTKTVYLKEHVPLIISYLRSFIESDGTVSEGVDVYKIGFGKIRFAFRKW